MKVFYVSILFICVLSATFSKWMLIGTFELNQQYISQQLCINKNQPSAGCNGHCFLNKQLNNEEKPGSPFTTNSSERFEIQLYYNALPEHEITNPANKTFYSDVTFSFCLQQFLTVPFQPPKA